MIRSCRTLGLIVAAALATTALFASSAPAAEFHHESIEPAGFLGSNAGEGAHNFTAGLIGPISCNTATFAGTEYVGSTRSTLEVSPAFSGCTFLGVPNVAVNIEGCTYRLNSPSGSPFAGSFTVLCPVNKKINFTALGCTIEIGQQTVSSIGYTNLGTSPKSIRMVANLTGITYTAGICPGATGTHSNGTYSGSTIVTAEAELGGQVGVYVN